MRCCARDEGWPFGVALRGEAPNHRVLRWPKTVVVSDAEKAQVMRQVGIRKTVRSLEGEIAVDRGGIKTGAFVGCPGDQPGGCPLIGRAVSGT